MKKKYLTTYAAVIMVLLFFTTSTAFAELSRFLDTEFYLDGNTKADAQISPDGKYIAYLSPSKLGVYNIWIQTLGNNDDHPITREKKNNIRGFDWAFDNKHIIYLNDNMGTEDFHVYATNIETQTTKDLTPYNRVKAQNLLLNKDHPSEILVGLNKRDSRHFDMYRIDLKSGKVVLDTENPGDVRWWLADKDFVIRAAVGINPGDVSTILRVRDSADKPWRDLVVWPFGETGHLEGYGSEIAVAFTPDGKALYVQAAFDGNHTQLAKVDTRTGKVLKMVASHPNASIWNLFDITLYTKANVLFNPQTGKVRAVGFYYLLPQWKVVDPEIEKDFNILKKIREGIFKISSQDISGQLWTVKYLSDINKESCYIYNRKTKKATPWFENSPSEDNQSYAPMKPVIIKSRDGVDIPCYLTLPVGKEPKNLPMVLDIHGGPWARDMWGFQNHVQRLVEWGYAVLQVNFRGSTGFGNKFLNAGNGQWGVGHMQNDVTDAARWFIKKGIAHPKKIAIMGGSYGGYAVLAGLAFTPDLYACGISICGPSNMKTSIEGMPDWWHLIKKRWLRRMGNVLEDDELNRRISPLFYADRIKGGLLIIHGSNDPRVKIEESDQIVNAMRKNKKEVVYVVYPDEGHGIKHPRNYRDMVGRIKKFLAKYLAGNNSR